MERQEELFFKMNLFEQHLKQIRAQLDAVENGIIELNKLSEGLAGIKGKTGEEILAPMGKGVYVKAKLLSEKLIVDIGNKTLLEKDIDWTNKTIAEQIEKLNEAKIELEQTFERMGAEMNSLIQEAQKSE